MGIDSDDDSDSFGSDSDDDDLPRGSCSGTGPGKRSAAARDFGIVEGAMKGNFEFSKHIIFVVGVILLRINQPSSEAGL